MRIPLALLSLMLAGALVPDTRAAPPPLPVTGIEGVTFLTADPAAVRRFYGHGAGFTAVHDLANEFGFSVGANQWLFFIIVPNLEGHRRLRSVTLGTDHWDEVEHTLKARGVATPSPVDAGPRVLQLKDPVGNRIDVQENAAGPAVPRPAGQAFSSHLQHMGFSVDRRHAEETIAFYRDTLGFPEAFRMNNPDGRLGLVKFRVPGSGRELIELIFYDPPLDKWAAGAFDHVNFEVTDIDETYRFLRRGGIATQARHLPQVNGEHLWAINLTDPELTRIEIQVLSPTAVPMGTVSTIGREP